LPFLGTILAGLVQDPDFQSGSRSADPTESGSIPEPDLYPKHGFFLTKSHRKIEPTGKTSLEDRGPKQKIKVKRLLMVSLVHSGTYFKFKVS
jgi:hypothetical protein